MAAAIGREDAPVLALRGVRRRYRSRWALRGIDLHVSAGELLALVGPNGAGKSTAIRIATGLDRATDGSVVRPRRLGYCPQENVFYADLTVRENLRFAGAMYRVPWGLRRARAERLATELGLGPHMRKRAGELSGGMQRRLTIGLALMHDPSVLVIEEPEAGLDPHSRAAVRGFLAALRDQGKGILLTTHDVVEAERIADRVAILDDGHIIADGDPASLVSRYDSLVGAPDPVTVERGHMTLEELFLGLTGARA